MKYAHFDNLTLERLTEALGKIRDDDDYAPYPWVELFDDYSGNVKKVSGSGMSDDIVFTFNNREELAKWVDDMLEGGDAYM